MESERQRPTPGIQPVSVVNFSTTRFRTAYGPRVRLNTVVTGASRTKQSFKDECDINRIMARYQATGVLEHVKEATQAQYTDCTQLEYQSAMELVANAQSLFAELPSQVRDRFENDPAKLLEFVHNPDNLEESIELGFVDPTKLSDGLKAGAAIPIATPPSPTSPAAPPQAPGASSGGPTGAKPRSPETGD